MIIASNNYLVAVSYDTATYHDLKCFVDEHPFYTLQRVDPQEFLQSDVVASCYINLVIRDVVLRKQVTEKLDTARANRFSLIHDRACVTMINNIAPGCMIYPLSVIYPGAIIDRDVIIHSMTLVAHQCKIMVGAFISGGITIAGNTTIGSFTQIGIDSTIYDQINIASNTVIGAGTVVRKNISESGTYSSQQSNNLIKVR